MDVVIQSSPRPWLALVVVLATACPPSAPCLDPMSATAPTLSSWCRRFASERCRRLTGCGFADADTACECASNVRRDCEARLTRYSAPVFDFDPAAAATCLEALGRSPCLEGFADCWHERRRATNLTHTSCEQVGRAWVPPECRAAPFRPRVVEVGGACDWVGGCVSACITQPELAWNCGLCTAAPDAGPCARSVTGSVFCDSSVALRTTVGDGGVGECECVGRAADGAPCNSDDLCESRVCNAKWQRCGHSDAGEACLLERDCAPGLFCAGLEVFFTPVAQPLVRSEGTCVPRVAHGAACAPAQVDDGCAEPGDVCVQGVCAARFSLAAGEPCDDQDQCGSGLWCEPCGTGCADAGRCASYTPAAVPDWLVPWPGGEACLPR